MLFYSRKFLKNFNSQSRIIFRNEIKVNETWICLIFLEIADMSVQVFRGHPNFVELSFLRFPTFLLVAKVKNFNSELNCLKVNGFRNIFIHSSNLFWTHPQFVHSETPGACLMEINFSKNHQRLKTSRKMFKSTFHRKYLLRVHSPTSQTLFPNWNEDWLKLPNKSNTSVTSEFKSMQPNTR